jgi:hypothetical protein
MLECRHAWRGMADDLRIGAVNSSSTRLMPMSAGVERGMTRTRSGCRSPIGRKKSPTGRNPIDGRLSMWSTLLPP